MRLRSLLLTATLTAGLLATMPANADNSSGNSEVIVALVDTGVRATHQEFNYQGKTSTTDQFVGWWDFSGETTPELLPAPGETWDTRVDNPFDNNGHGTATASSAVGLNIAVTKEKSFAPGYKLAVAKVGEGDGTISGDITAAVRWAVDSVKADVVNISIGPLIPVPSSLDDIDETIEYARSRGVLVTVSNGNGLANFGIPGDPGWANPFSIRESLTVGGSSLTTSARITTDPEVTAKFTQRLASKSCDTCYASISGTSFSAPLVAGMAARLMKQAIDNGRSASPDYIETLLKYSATDTSTPPNLEGYGALDDPAFTPALAHAAGGTLPARPNPDLSGTYVETVSNGLRDAWSKTLDEDSLGRSYQPLPGLNGAPGAGVLSTSVPTGLEDVDAYTITLPPGGTLTFDLDYTNYNTPTFTDPITGSTIGIDVDVYVFSGTGPFDANTFVDVSGAGGGIPESISYASVDGGTYTVLVVGWIVADRVTYSAVTNATFSSEGYYLVKSFLI